MWISPFPLDHGAFFRRHGGFPAGCITTGGANQKAMTVFAILDSIRENRIIRVDRDSEYHPLYGAGEDRRVEDRPVVQ